MEQTIQPSRHRQLQSTPPGVLERHTGAFEIRTEEKGRVDLVTRQHLGHFSPRFFPEAKLVRQSEQEILGLGNETMGEQIASKLGGPSRGRSTPSLHLGNEGELTG